MIRWAVLLGICAATFLMIVGCGDGVAITRRERAERHKKILDLDAREFNDDWDLLWLNDRPNYLTPYRVR